MTREGAGIYFLHLTGPSATIIRKIIIL